MQTGRIKWFNPEKGYGFIIPDSGGDDIFLHISAVEELGVPILEPGQKVKFSIEQNSNNANKKSATDLQLVD